MSYVRVASAFGSLSLAAMLFGGCGPGEPPSSTFCGGFAGIACPDGQRCVDDPNDGCDPKNGGADCGGICVPDVNPCAAVLCLTGSECIVQNGKATCVPIGEKCGNTTCPSGTSCCNPLRPICVKPGMVCAQ